MANQTTTRTKKAGPVPILGGLFGQKPHYETRITDGRRTATGAGRTAEEAERNASRKWQRR